MRWAIALRISRQRFRQITDFNTRGDEFVDVAILMMRIDELSRPHVAGRDDECAFGNGLLKLLRKTVKGRDAVPLGRFQPLAGLRVLVPVVRRNVDGRDHAASQRLA